MTSGPACGRACRRSAFEAASRPQNGSPTYKRRGFGRVALLLYSSDTRTFAAEAACHILCYGMSAVHFVSGDAPPDPCDVTHKCKFFTLTLSKVCSDEVQRVANWQCMTHGVEGAVLMEFENKEAVVSATEWVIRHNKEYKALRAQGPPTEAFFSGEKGHEALEKANALETLFLRQPVPWLVRLCWLTEEDEVVDDDLKMVMTNAGDFSSDGGVVRIVVQDGGEEVQHQRVAITSVVMPLTAEELFPHRR